ncbi:MAG TPA: SWIM zinc finger family protein [Planktothrix sp.]|jgi:hypothetical protein
MSIPSYEQIITLAPDESSAKSGRELANRSKWKTLGYNEFAAWGECQGGGSTPYQTCISILENTFKCTCPSRKFPCKHGLGLYLLLSKEQGAFTQKEPPPWVADWLAHQIAKTAKKTKKKDTEAKPVDPVAQAKRLAERHAKVKAGTEDLDRFLQDLIRHGLASVQSETYGFWEAQAKRLVDSQAPGLARMLRDCAGTASTGENWQDRLLRQIGQIYLLLQAYERFQLLPAELQADVRTALGFTTDQDEVLASNAVADTWHVVAQRVEQEERLRMQRTWLIGKNSSKRALILSFAHGTSPLDTSLLAGSTVQAELSFYPSAYPMRAVLKNKSSEQLEKCHLSGHATLHSALESYSDALAVSPWIEKFPLSVADVVPESVASGKWAIRDKESRLAPLIVSSMAGWQILAASGGKPISMFGEFDGEKLMPMSIMVDEKFYRI